MMVSAEMGKRLPSSFWRRTMYIGVSDPPKVLLQRNLVGFQPKNVYQTYRTTKHAFSGNTYDLCETSHCHSANTDFAPLPSPIGVGLDPVSCFGQWNSSKCDVGRSHECTCVVGLVLELQRGTWEECVLPASIPSAQVPEQTQREQAMPASPRPEVELPIRALSKAAKPVNPGV